MTNEEKAMQFAIDNCSKYINDEEPLCALRDAYLRACEEKDRQFLELLKRKRDEACTRRDGHDLWSSLWLAEHRFACGLNGLINELSGQQDSNQNIH